MFKPVVPLPHRWWESRHLRREATQIVIALVTVVLLFATMLTQVQVQAQTEPTLTAIGNTDETNVSLGVPFELKGTGLTPNSSVGLEEFVGPDCRVGRRGIGVATDSSGVAVHEQTVLTEGKQSWRMVDPELGVTNCVNTTTQPPSLAINGGFGPVTVRLDDQIVWGGFGLTPNTTVDLVEFSGPGCLTQNSSREFRTDSRGGFDADSTITSTQSLSYHVLESTRGASNCVDVQLLPPILTINGSDVSILVEINDPILWRGEGLTPNTIVDLEEFDGTGCQQSLNTRILDTDAGGIATDNALFAVQKSLSYQFVDPVVGVSNCVDVIFLGEPALTANGSAGLIDVSIGVPFVLRGTGLSPNSDVGLDEYIGSGCRFGRGTIIVDTDSSGVAIHEATVLTGGQQSWLMVDRERGQTNCVNTRTLPPSLTVNGSTGPLTIDFGDTFSISGSGLLPNESVNIDVFSGVGCLERINNRTIFTDESGNGAITTTFDSVGTFSFRINEPGNELSNCVDVTFVEDETPTPTPTETAVATETAVPTETEVPTDVTPTVVETENPTIISTEPVEPTATSTSEPSEPGSAVITVTTGDGSEIPVGTSVCLDGDCQNLDALASLVAAAAPSGTQVSFGGVEPGSHALTVVVGGSQVVARTIEIVSGEVTNVTIELSATGDPATPVAPNPVVPNPPAAPVIQLPSTGAGSSSSVQFTMLFALGGVMLLTAGVAWKRRSGR